MQSILLLPIFSFFCSIWLTNSLKLNMVIKKHTRVKKSGVKIVRWQLYVESFFKFVNHKFDSEFTKTLRSMKPRKYSLFCTMKSRKAGDEHCQLLCVLFFLSVLATRYIVFSWDINLTSMLLLFCFMTLKEVFNLISQVHAIYGI